MTERENKRTLAELLLGEPEIVAWLGDGATRGDDETDERDAPRAA